MQPFCLTSRNHYASVRLHFMKITAALASLHKIDADVLALTLLGKKLSPLGNEVDKALGGLLSRIIKKEDLGKVDSAKVINTLGKPESGKFSFDYLILVGLGEAAHKFHSDHLRKAASRAVQTAQKIRAKRLALEIPTGGKKFSPESLATAATEGVLLGDYSFDRYKSKKEPGKTVHEVLLIGARKDPLEKGIQQGEAAAQATLLARDLINTPACDMTPKHLAEQARELGRLPGVTVKILEKKEIERLKMGAFLAVAQGSTQPPYFIHLHYRPAGKPESGKIKRKVALVGKGITFDSGGLSLKTPSTYMETMKDDMSGAAAVLGVMQALTRLKLPVEVHGVIAATENMPSGSADKPGDIATTSIGKTIEILNTDAEGRLTLADALPFALKQKPDLVIDIATLTGACVVALGELCAGVMGNDQKLMDQLIESGNAVGEKLWQLPLIEEYQDDIKSPIADVKNTGGRFAGTITAGLFLQEFVDPKIPWAHVDIAGPAFSEKDRCYVPRGGTGFLVRTLLHFLGK